MGYKCPKCGYERRPEDFAPEYECPKCGVIYEKGLKRLNLNDKTQQDVNNQKEKISFVNHLKKHFYENKKIYLCFSAGIPIVIVILAFFIFDFEKKPNFNNMPEIKKTKTENDTWDISDIKLGILISEALNRNFDRQFPDKYNQAILNDFQIIEKEPFPTYCACRISVHYTVRIERNHSLEMISVEKIQKFDARLFKNDFDEFELEITEAYFAETVSKENSEATDRNDVKKEKVNIDFRSSEGYEKVCWGDTLYEVKQEFGPLIELKDNISSKKNLETLNIEKYEQEIINSVNIKKREFTFLEGQLVEVHNRLDLPGAKSSYFLEKLIETYGDNYSLYESGEQFNLNSNFLAFYTWHKDETIIHYADTYSKSHGDLHYIKYKSKVFDSFIHKYEIDKKKNKKERIKDDLDL